MAALTKGTIVTLLVIAIAVSLVGTMTLLETSTPTTSAVAEKPANNAPANINSIPEKQAANLTNTKPGNEK